MKANRDDICVIGAGRFGKAVVEELVSLKKYVLAIDNNEENLMALSKIANQVVVIDAGNIDSLKAIGVQSFDTVIVGISNNINIIATLLELGVKNIIAKASDVRHERVLKQIGVAMIVKPDVEAGIRTALIATNPQFIKSTEKMDEIGDGYATLTTALKNKYYTNKSLIKLKLFNRLGINLISIKRKSKVFLPSGISKLQLNDLITMIGKVENLSKALFELNKGDEEDGEN